MGDACVERGVVVAVDAVAAADRTRNSGGLAHLIGRAALDEQGALGAAKVVGAVNGGDAQAELAELAGDVAGEFPALVVGWSANAGQQLVRNASVQLELAELRRA